MRLAASCPFHCSGTVMGVRGGRLVAAMIDLGSIVPRWN